MSQSFIELSVISGASGDDVCMSFDPYEHIINIQSAGTSDNNCFKVIVHSNDEGLGCALQLFSNFHQCLDEFHMVRTNSEVAYEITLNINDIISSHKEEVFAYFTAVGCVSCPFRIGCSCGPEVVSCMSRHTKMAMLSENRFINTLVFAKNKETKHIVQFIRTSASLYVHDTDTETETEADVVAYFQQFHTHDSTSEETSESRCQQNQRACCAERVPKRSSCAINELLDAQGVTREKVIETCEAAFVQYVIPAITNLPFNSSTRDDEKAAVHSRISLMLNIMVQHLLPLLVSDWSTQRKIHCEQDMNDLDTMTMMRRDIIPNFSAHLRSSAVAEQEFIPHFCSMLMSLEIKLEKELENAKYQGSNYTVNNLWYRAELLRSIHEPIFGYSCVSDGSVLLISRVSANVEPASEIPTPKRPKVKTNQLRVDYDGQETSPANVLWPRSNQVTSLKDVPGFVNLLVLLASPTQLLGARSVQKCLSGVRYKLSGECVCVLGCGSFCTGVDYRVTHVTAVNESVQNVSVSLPVYSRPQQEPYAAQVPPRVLYKVAKYNRTLREGNTTHQSEQQMELEMKTLRAMGSHHNLPYVVDHCPEYSFIVYRDVGVPLMEYLWYNCRSKESRISFARVMLKQLLEVLCFVHKHDIVHCDVRPWNIVVAMGDGGVNSSHIDVSSVRIILIDWGLCSKVNAELHDHNGSNIYAHKDIIHYGIQKQKYIKTRLPRDKPAKLLAQFKFDLCAAEYIAAAALCGDFNEPWRCPGRNALLDTSTNADDDKERERVVQSELAVLGYDRERWLAEATQHAEQIIQECGGRDGLSPSAKRVKTDTTGEGRCAAPPTEQHGIGCCQKF